jgi:hypothetical protein
MSTVTIALALSQKTGVGGVGETPNSVGVRGVRSGPVRRVLPGRCSGSVRNPSHARCASPKVPHRVRRRRWDLGRSNCRSCHLR